MRKSIQNNILIAILFLLIHQVVNGQNAHTFNIGERTLHYKDEKRNRPIVTEVWYPTTDTLKASDKKYAPVLRNYTVRDGSLPAGKLPLIMVSHGTGGSRHSLEWLAQSLVQSGFIVAAVDHWGNTTDNKIPVEFMKPWERPQDISFALTQLLNEKDFRAVIDSQKIGALGFSFGGYTVIALAGGVVDYPVLIHYYRTVGHKEVEFPEYPGLGRLLYDSTLLAATKKVPNLKDSRIHAFFALSPGTGPGFLRKQQFKNVQRPVFIIGSLADSMAPVKSNARVYHKLINGSGYYEFGGKVGHYVMLSEADDELKKEAPVPFVDDPGVNRHQVHLKVESLAGDFFKRNLK
ncbi:dienelactone hydrolase [Pseudoflavitalea sp. G-6-1-2]|uniref:alpha/beta hydrolase family protein n=1 Tax=Pseudoflavitalea sp. G-6-1-2 TaxID=2728841 RepID=UPI00146C79A2|nr:dienelactone hydrolase [Pseudoflavitalea sp. G-6-1-2]NML22908.1 dienelactone hydrolase [Pseudoflavitalea sp. G-6-1-2]